MAEGQRKRLRKNPELHPWKSHDKFSSPPCNHLKEQLRAAGLDFEEEVQPLSERFFSVDIAFSEARVAVEVNGNQHYESRDVLAPYYQERHDLIEAAGWKVLEIHFANVYNKEFVSRLIDSLVVITAPFPKRTIVTG